MKVILSGVTCHTCHAPVTVVRRDVEQPCDACLFCDNGHEAHTHTLRDVGPFTPVDDDGTRHECVR